MEGLQSGNCERRGGGNDAANCDTEERANRGNLSGDRGIDGGKVAGGDLALAMRLLLSAGRNPRKMGVRISYIDTEQHAERKLAFSEGDLAGKVTLDLAGFIAEQKRAIEIDTGGLTSDLIATKEEGDFSVP